MFSVQTVAHENMEYGLYLFASPNAINSFSYTPFYYIPFVKALFNRISIAGVSNKRRGNAT